MEVVLLKDNEISLKKGVFTLSLDTELSWGAVDKPHALIKNRPYYEKSREVTDKMLSLMEKYNISATWAVVGHLFLDKCEKECPCTDLEDSPLWYGRDIIKKIMDSKVYQEIGSHSFSHIIFGDKNTRRETIAADIKKCIEESKKIGLEMESFVFPRNSIGYIDEIKKAGFKVFRGVEPSWYSKFPGGIKKVCHIIDQILAVTPPVNNPLKREGLIDIPASMLYLPMNGFRKYIPLKSRILKAERGIKKAVDERKIFHLWFHPFNIATNPEKLLYGLENIFEKVDHERRKGNLQIKTMKEMACSISCTGGKDLYGE